jgi:carbon storage regulator CsrA
MLVLSRKRQESVMVGDYAGLGSAVRVTGLGIEQGCVRLGLEAVANVPVHREEVWDRLHEARAGPQRPSCETGGLSGG